MVTKHTPTPWVGYDGSAYKTLKDADYERAFTCVNAFHSEDGREIPTEAITEGLFWEMRDTMESIAEETAATWVSDKIRALLAKLEPQK